MASSRKRPATDLPGLIEARLREALRPGARVVLGLSGGVDSVVLLALLAQFAPALRFSLRAVHVNHGISPNAPSWAEFCERLCRQLGIPLEIERVDLEPYRSLGPEAAARRARYDVFARADAEVIVLAQHRDDQAETLLLQLLRGAGLAGLSGMPEIRALAARGTVILRPLLATGRAQIEAFARSRGLSWVEDESNADSSLRRNFLRHRVMPLLRSRFPAADSAMARSAAHLAEGRQLLEELARQDLAGEDLREGIALARLRELGPARARNAIRYLCAELGMAAPGTRQLDDLWRQLDLAAWDSMPHIALPGWDLRRYRGRLYIERRHSAAPGGICEPWRGEPALPLLALGGVLNFRPEEGRGLAVEKLRGVPVTLRLRRGGERLQPDCRRPRRTLKNLFQERGIPPWRRDRVPLLYCGESLVSVPGVGDDCAWQAQRGEPGLIVSWEVLED